MKRTTHKAKATRSKPRAPVKAAGGAPVGSPPPELPIVNILERISDGIVAFDAGMNYTYANARGAEMLGRKPENLIGKNYWVEFPEAKGAPFAEAYTRALETQKPLVIEDYYAPWERWFENRIYPSPDGLSIFFTEITERKRMEAELRMSEQKFSTIFEKAPFSASLAGRPDGRIEQVNQEFERLFGYSRQEAIGKTSLELGLYPDPKAREEAAAKFEEHGFARDVETKL
jgi:PAS domain S-box-containing protein